MTPEGRLAVARAKTYYPLGVIANAIAALEGEIAQRDRTILELRAKVEEEQGLVAESLALLRHKAPAADMGYIDPASLTQEQLDAVGWAPYA